MKRIKKTPEKGKSGIFIPDRDDLYLGGSTVESSHVAFGYFSRENLFTVTHGGLEYGEKEIFSREKLTIRRIG